MAEENSTQIERDYSRVSFTAYLVSHWRALSDIAYAKDISKLLDAENVSREVLGDKLDQMSWFGAAMIEARNKALAREVKKIGCKNIYGFAEGALPTGMVMTADPDVKYLHSDLPVMLSEAEVVLRNLMVRDGLQRPNLRFMSVNALDGKQLQDGASYFQGQPFVMTNKGLLMYLNEDEKNRAFREIGNTQRNNNGLAWITTDINVKDAKKNVFSVLGPKYAGVLKECLDLMAKKTGGNNVRENFFDNYDSAHRMMDAAGFDFERRPFFDGSFELSSLEAVPKDMRQGMIDMFSERNIYIMSPRRK